MLAEDVLLIREGLENADELLSKESAPVSAEKCTACCVASFWSLDDVRDIGGDVLRAGPLFRLGHEVGRWEERVRGNAREFTGQNIVRATRHP